MQSMITLGLAIAMLLDGQKSLEKYSHTEAWRELNDKVVVDKLEGNETESSWSALILSVVVKSNLGFLNNDGNVF